MASIATQRNRQKFGERSPAEVVVLENLHARLAAGGLRPRDALLLRRLGVPPFVDSVVYELDRGGYVTGVGMPENMKRVDPSSVKTELEARFGVPAAMLALAPTG